MSRHPNDRRLEEWLAHGTPAKIEAHVENCERSASHLEELDATGTTPLHESLAGVLEPPTEIAESVLGRVEEALAGRAALEAFVGLLGAGIEAARVVLAADEPDTTAPANPSPEEDVR